MSLLAPQRPRTRRVVARRGPLAPVRRYRRIGIVAAVGGLLFGALALLMVVTAGLTLLMPYGSNEETYEPAECGPFGLGTGDPGSNSAQLSQLTEDQVENARIIMETGRDLDVPTYGWVVALATALQESWLTNIDYGDRDSVGLFQQRDAWGSFEDRMDPPTSATMFYTGGRAGQSGLLDIEGWQQMSVTDAAQAVQRSAFPTAYAKHEPLARALVEAGGEEVSGGCGIPPALLADCPATGWGAEQGLTPDALLVLRCVKAKFDELTLAYGLGERPAGGDGDHAAGRAVDLMIPTDMSRERQVAWGDRVIRWLRSNHQNLGIKYLIWNERIWSVARSDEGWRTYRHYQGCTSDTCLHRDHIHVSVYGDAAILPGSGDWVLPLDPGSYRITARFGQGGSQWVRDHSGLDFGAPTGTPVFAASDGVVSWAGQGSSIGSAYGTVVQIRHDTGAGRSLETIYAHLSSFDPDLDIGDRVKAGMFIGEVGSTGNSTGPHLHFEVRVDGTPTDPEAWLQAHGVTP